MPGDIGSKCTSMRCSSGRSMYCKVVKMEMRDADGPTEDAASASSVGTAASLIPAGARGCCTTWGAAGMGAGEGAGSCRTPCSRIPKMCPECGAPAESGNWAWKTSAGKGRPVVSWRCIWSEATGAACSSMAAALARNSAKRKRSGPAMKSANGRPLIDCTPSAPLSGARRWAALRDGSRIAREEDRCSSASQRTDNRRRTVCWMFSETDMPALKRMWDTTRSSTNQRRYCIVTSVNNSDATNTFISCGPSKKDGGPCT
mmetsp:Transcript_87753/g.271742  ORF Transcript_87753/g.271742 Transcript_87753/m.271742 type:complete len:259 (+) Transcript_87753:186-962(+)